MLLAAVAAGLLFAQPAAAQKPGGILRAYNSSNPPSASIIEEATIATAMAFSGVFNNLVMFDQAKPRNALDAIVPELAVSWSWDAPRTRLTFKLRQGVRWHDGKLFTAKDSNAPGTESRERRRIRFAGTRGRTGGPICRR